MESSIMTYNYPRLHDNTPRHFHELQAMGMPSQFTEPYHVSGHANGNAVGSPLYELTQSDLASACAVDESAAEVPEIHHSFFLLNQTRKRKNRAFDKIKTEESLTSRCFSDIKQNHSEIEKRRRDKMNTYINELSSIIPMCGAMSRKLDKLSVLRMAVQHMRSIRGSLTACPLAAHPKCALLSDRELNSLILQAADDCFLIVVGCDRGRLLYVSASAQKMLHYEKNELLGQSLFDLLHPKDVAKVKEQLSSSDHGPRERLIDAKTMQPLKMDYMSSSSGFCPGARRSFFCRIKCRTPKDLQTYIKEESEPSRKMRKKHSSKKYAVVQCTGYLKSWVSSDPTEDKVEPEVNEDVEGNNLTCLVALGRGLSDLTPPASKLESLVHSRPQQFISRLATDGKFLFVDQRVTLALGYLPQELIGTSLYEYVTGPELGSIARAHKTALFQRQPLVTPAYTLRRKDGTLVRIITHFKPFRNPWTKDVECLVANNTLITKNTLSKQEESLQNFDVFNYDRSSAGGTTPDHLLSEPDLEVQRLIASQVESHKIGSAIAEEALRKSTPAFLQDISAELMQDVYNSQQPSVVDPSQLSNSPIYAELLEAQASANDVATGSAEAAPCSPPRSISPPLILDGNGEATMAVIMSLLEADAGLGEATSFSKAPWSSLP